MEPVQVFISYARKDGELLKNFLEHLKPLQRSGHISAWYDRDISSGSEWRKTLDFNLDAAELFLLIVSPSFIYSDFIYDVEMSRAMVRYERGEAIVLPVIFRPVEWSFTPFAKIQALPRDAKPVTSWDDPDEAYLDIIKGIRQVVDEFRKNNSNRDEKALEGISNVEERQQTKNVKLEKTIIPAKIEHVLDKRVSTYIKKLLQQIEVSQSKNKQVGIEWLEVMLENPPNIEPVDNWLYICLEFHLRFLGEEIMRRFSNQDSGKPTGSFAEYFFQEMAGKISGYPLVLGKYYPANSDTEITLTDIGNIVNHLDRIKTETQEIKDFIEIYTSLSHFVPDEGLIDEVVEKIDELVAVYLNLDARISKCGGKWTNVHREIVEIFDDLCDVMGAFSNWLLERAVQAKFSDSYF